MPHIQREAGWGRGERGRGRERVAREPLSQTVRKTNFKLLHRQHSVCKVVLPQTASLLRQRICIVQPTVDTALLRVRGGVHG